MARALSVGLPSSQSSPDLAEGQEAGERSVGQAARGGGKNTSSGVGKLGCHLCSDTHFIVMNFFACVSSLLKLRQL